MHWTNAVAMLVMITSGWGIYDDDVIIRGLHFSKDLRLGDWAAWSLNWHFAGMWLLTINGLCYLVYGVLTGRLRERLLPIRLHDVIQTVRDTLRLKIEHNDLTTYNAVQKILYIVAILAGIFTSRDRPGDLEAGPVLRPGLAAGWLPMGARHSFCRYGGDRRLPGGARAVVAGGSAHLVGDADRWPARGTIRSRRAGGNAMNSLFRPRKRPDPAILDDQRALLRSLERRRLIRGGLSLGALTMLTGCDVSRPPSVEAALLAISRLNDGLQAWLFDPNKLAPTYPASMVLKPPKFNAYYDVMDVKPVKGSDWRFELAGLIADKRPWTLPQINALPQSTEIIKHICVEGWDYVGQWTGVPLRAFLERVGADLRAKYVAFKTADDYPSSIDMATALHPQTLLATRYADDMLADPFGYPLRLRMSTKLGYKNPKWVTAIEVTNTYPGGYWEKQGFPWFAGI